MSDPKPIQDLRARYNAGGNAIIPNTFQHPNMFIDKLMYYLTANENVTLTFAVRRILGFQTNIMSRKDNISLSQFTDGITAEDGRSLSKGCGLSPEAVRIALNGLAEAKILLPTTETPDPRKGQEYWLQDNENAINWEWLEARDVEKREKNALRTSKARYSVRQKGTVGQKARGTVGQKARVLSDRNTKPTETQGNPPTDIPEVQKTGRRTAAKVRGDSVDGILFFGQQALQQGEDKIEEVLNHLEKGLHVNIVRSLANQTVAKRILKDGRSIDQWLSWVMAEEWRAAHTYIYADLEKVWRDWPQAFVKDEQPTRPEHKKIAHDPQEKFVPNPFPKPAFLPKTNR